MMRTNMDKAVGVGGVPVGRPVTDVGSEDRMACTQNNTGRRTRGRRGVAMLMIVVALVVTTVLTTALLTSPDAMGPIADNARNTAEARWSAQSAGNFTTAAIAEQLSAVDAGGDFKTGWAIAGANASVRVTNAKGEAPAADDREIFVTVTSEAGGISKTVQKRVLVAPPVDPVRATSPMLGEMAVYAHKMQAENLRVTTWGASPEARSGVARLAIGFPSHAHVQSSGLSVSGPIVLNENPSSSLRSWAESQASAGVVELPLRLPLAHVAAPSAPSRTWTVGDEDDGYDDDDDDLVASLLGVPADVVVTLEGMIKGSDGDVGSVDINGAGQDETILPGRYDELEADNGATLRLPSGTYAFDEVHVNNGALVHIEGDVVLVVRCLKIDNRARIVVDPGASLLVHIEEELHVDNHATIGPWVADDDVGKVYLSPSRVTIQGSADAELKLRQASVVADIQAPWGHVELHDTHLFGRVTALELDADDAVVFYDPTLDSRAGFANLKGPLYDEDGDPIPGLAEAIDHGTSADQAALSAALTRAVQDHWDLEGGPPATSASGYSSVSVSSRPVGVMVFEKAADFLDEVFVAAGVKGEAKAVQGGAASMANVEND